MTKAVFRVDDATRRVDCAGVWAGFSGWLADLLPKLPVNLNIKSSSRVPGGIERECSGVEDVLDSYRWKASWTDADGAKHESIDWRTTQDSISKLRSWLLESVCGASSDDEFQKACLAVVSWGGGTRSGDKGAKGFVLKKSKQGDLREYFIRASKALRLDSSQPIHGIEAMNAMLIKIHAFLSVDGLPIYDSRVSGCAGALLELYVRANNVVQFNLPQLPSTDENRAISRLIEGCSSRSVIRYGSADCVVKWARSAVSLGRLLKDVLTERPDLFQQVDGLPNRMRALEAAMFMIGADLRSLRPAFASYSKAPVRWIE